MQLEKLFWMVLVGFAGTLAATLLLLRSGRAVSSSGAATAAGKGPRGRPARA